MNLIEGNQQLGYIFAATLFSLFGLLFMWICYSGVKERYVETQPANPAQKPGLLQSFRAIAGNRPLFILCIANLCTLGAFNVKLAIQVYYTQYVLNDPILLSYMGFFQHGLYFHRRIPDACLSQTFWQEESLYRRPADLGAGRSAQLFLRRRFGQLRGVLLPWRSLAQRLLTA